MCKILICGGNSFVAKGLYDSLKSNNYIVDTFSRGINESRINNKITGNYINISNNSNLEDYYDIIINFSILKDDTLDNNITYIKSLLETCKRKKIKKLIHFSSIMVYNYSLNNVNETTSIETLDNTLKRGYGEIKIGVDQFLLSQKNDLPFEVVLVRPGYVLADDRPCPFIKKLPLGLSIIKGNKKSKQPIVKREDIHKALIRIIETENNLSVYHFFPNDGMTKYKYAKNTVGGIILTMPKCIFKYIPFLFSKIGLISKSLYSRFEGMYIESNFSSKLTEEKLNIKFK